MSIHEFGYSVESLQKDKIGNREREFESQTKLINLKLNDISEKFEKFNNLQNTKLRTEGTGGASRALRVEEIQLKYGETNIIINAK